MAKNAVISLSGLEQDTILVAERYDPIKIKLNGKGIPISECVTIIREQVMPSITIKSLSYLIFDTGQAKNGFLSVEKPPVSSQEIGSAKKVFQHGDVIISRLRPYLRQVAFVDPLINSYFNNDALLLCSTEFYILRTSDNKSIAFLVPFLLSTSAQEIFASSQEGGHHPRFNQDILERLRIPEYFIKNRLTISKEIENALIQIRKGDIELKKSLMSMKD